jgi:hypothetical protein
MSKLSKRLAMATKEEKQELLEILKFTPRTYKISMWGYGGEKVMGTVDPKVWDYCMEHQVDLVDVAWNHDACEEMGLDEDLLPFTPGSWYECDSMAHVNGVSRNAGHIQIEDENGDTVFEKSLDDCDGCEDSPGWSCQDEVWIGSRKKGEVVFIGSSNEKGTFFEGEFELRAPFDIEKLELYYDEVDGEEIVNCVYYDGEEIDNNGGSTDGKSSDMIMVRLTDDEGNFERYEPEEKDWGHPEYGTSPSDWESSPKFKFKKQKPTIPGYYSCNYGYGSTYGSLYWDGNNFGDWEYGKFLAKDDDGIVSWSGYDWDTSDWGNQPPEPPSLICDNKKCGWVGSSDDRREDEEYNSHCPECDGTEFTWIDYDPNTATGRKNRAKYCVTAMPTASVDDLEAALEELKAEYEQLMATPLEEEWVSADVNPSIKGTYECEFESTTWPFPIERSCEWTGRSWKEDGKKAVGVKRWRILKESNGT